MTALTPLTGEPLAVDLVNTRPLAVDLLATHDDLRVWLDLQAHRRPDAPVEFGDADLGAVHAVRDAVTVAIDHARRGARPPAAVLDVLNAAQRAAPAIRHLDWDGTSITAVDRRIGAPGTRLAAWLAEAAAGLLTDPAVTNIRECEADDCVLLFLPAHPRRRWCATARCGNRVRVARHYERHKSAHA